MERYNWVRIEETDDWIIDYDPEHREYRVSYFEDNHFKDEVIFCEYREAAGG